MNNLAEHVGAQSSAVSQSLAKLRLARLVKTRRDGTKVFYQAPNTHVRRLVEEALFHADHLVHDLPDHHERRPVRGRVKDGGKHERARQRRTPNPRPLATRRVVSRARVSQRLAARRSRRRRP
ncbi:MAG: hypothetical protein ABJD24_01620 [Acidimicrobiales bacterium]